MVNSKKAIRDALPEGKSPVAKQRSFLFIFIIILLIGNLASYFSAYGFGLSGSLQSFTKDLSSFKFQALAFLIQWGIMFGMLGIALMHHHAEPLPLVKNVEIRQDTKAVKKAFTDMDVLYATLQKKGNLKMSMIAEAFNIDKEKALEWSKILESHDLATLRYRVFAETELVAKGEE